jgi:hypothetical protein
MLKVMNFLVNIVYHVTDYIMFTIIVAVNLFLYL